MRSKGLIIVFIGSAIVFWSLFGLVIQCTPSNQRRAEKAIIAHLTKYANDPSSYEPIDFGELTYDTFEGEEIIYIIHYYRARNGFGQLRVGSVDVYFDQNLNIIDIDERY